MYLHTWPVVQAARKGPKQALWAGVDRLAGTGTGLQDERQANSSPSPGKGKGAESVQVA